MAGRRGRATMPDVAREAGVSVMTVSYAFSRPARVAPATRRRVLEAAARLGYTGPDPAARGLRRGRTGTLGVVLGEHLTYAFDDPQATAFLAGVAGVCVEHRLGLTLIPTSGDDTDLARVREAAVDALVVWTTVDDDPLLQAVADLGVPAVVHGGPAVPGLGLVAIDDRAAARAAGAAAFAGARAPAVMSFPLDRARRPALLRGPDPGLVRFPVTRHRLQGYAEAATDAGLDWSGVPVAVLARNDAAEAEATALRLLRDGPPVDAVAAMSDQIALGVLRAARHLGLTVPGRLAVTGWDDTPAAAPADLTTVAQSLRDQGRLCARTAIGATATAPTAADPTATAPAAAATAPADVPWRLVPRASTRSPTGDRDPGAGAAAR